MTSMFNSILLASALLIISPVSLSQGNNAEPSLSNKCIEIGKISSNGFKILTELQHSVEAAPMYLIPAASLGVKECRMKEVDPDDLILVLEYRFNNGGWLKIGRSESIESTIKEASFIFPTKEDPVAIMKLEEISMMGKNGCGIDWQHPEVEFDVDNKNIIDTQYWGKECNCSATIRRDNNKRVIGLRISDAC